MRGICLGHPLYYKVQHRYPMKYYLPANQAIEAAYPYRNQVFFGSQINGGPGLDTLLPKKFGGLSASQVDVLNQFLSRLRGVENQLAPDIIDFENLAIYEIKTEKYAEAGRMQLAGYYRLANELTAQLGMPPFNPDYAGWYPPNVMMLPGSTNKIVCTDLTNYDRSPSGVILYSIWKKLNDSDEDENKSAIKSALVLRDMTGLLAEARALVANEMRKPKNYMPPGEYDLLAPPSFWEALAAKAKFESTMRALQTPSRDLIHNPVFMARIAGAAAGVPSTAAGLAVLLALAGSAAAAGTAVEAGTIAAADAAITGSSIANVSNYLKIAQAANDNAVALAKAAGVILITMTLARTASAAEPKVVDFDQVFFAPVEEVLPVAPYTDGRAVTYRGDDYVTIGRATAVTH